MQFFDLKTQYNTIKTDVDSRVAKVLEHGQFIQGPEVKQLEGALAEFVGVKHCISTSSGTDSLLIALMALNVGSSDEVIIPGFAYAAPVEMCLLLGAKPVYVDIEKHTYNLDPTKLEAAISSKTKAIIPVSLYGHCADMQSINKIADANGIAVIEDGAQSFGALYPGGKSCGISTIGATSFFPTKPLGAYGDAGALFTNDDDLAQRLRQVALHGQNGKYNHVRLGVNGRLDTIQAAILLAKLEVFESELQSRIQVAKKYDALLAEHCPDVGRPIVLEGCTSAFAQYTVFIRSRDRVKERLAAEGVPTHVHYPLPLYKQVAYLDDRIELPECEHASNSVLSLPMGPYMKTADQKAVVGVLRSALLEPNG